MRLGTNLTKTENGALTHKSTLSPVLDLFSTGAAFRTRTDAQIKTAVEKAFCDDALTTLRTLFYFRDVRGGQGERRLFRVAMNFIANEVPEALRPNLKYVPEFGRWDDLLTFVGTPLETQAMELILAQLRKDISLESPSLLAKWLPSENTSSKATRALATKVRTSLGLSSKQYRKTLSVLRSRIAIVEKFMCQREFSAINYERVPSNASLKYRKAFSKRDAERYVAYLGDVKKGLKKINSKTLYPYDLVHEVFSNRSDETVDLQWNALPDYFNGVYSPGLVMADVSGSMSGRPLEVSISLAMYIAERNEGPFKNMFMTFSAQPEIQLINGKTLTDRVRNLSRAAWDMNTDLQAAFDTLLDTAIRTRAKQEDMPGTLYIVSDMEFDQAGRNNKKTNFEKAKQKFEKAGYKLPTVVFWNVNSRNDQQPVTMNEYGVMLVSGCSPAILKAVLTKTEVETVTPYELMMTTVNADRYQVITV